ncbi:hypothetical protein POX_h09818 [Penicillium oxalicum]|uniref:hypothetical protein n=1 Tax=Penicillium oxalicum TaxID=69781 RepID=UPI0020B69A5D|nr:hypothetical protein POX_h09818 [Penicillium oxalicum]KAI2786053.1 hypothetical protein POX_h09818 [Penicillium oxalicum]
MEKAYLPQWGQLPVEHYLIKQWDHSSSEPTGDQRLRLIHQFLDLDEIPKELDPNCHTSDTYETLSPTAYAIDTILRPWRSDDLRKIAWRIWGCDADQLILLRTHYNADDNHKITELVGSDELHEENVAWWALLDNPELFNFGDQWWRVFDILPELAGPLNDNSRLPNPENISRERQYFKNTVLPTLKQSDEWRANRDNCIEKQSDFLRRTASKGYLAIADQEAFETDMLRLIYLDGKRNIVQETRMAFDEQTFADVAVEWDQLSLPMQLWEDGKTGEKYRVNGELGRELYQLDEADLE